MSDIEEETQNNRRSYGKPYTSTHPVPTVKGYREHKNDIKHREQEADAALSGDDDEQDRADGEGEPSKMKKAFESVKAIAKGEDKQDGQGQPYPASNRNDPNRSKREDRKDSSGNGDDNNQKGHDDDSNQKQQKSAAETAAGHLDPKQKRKDMKKIKRHGGGREVTDPVTHLPVIVRDMTDKDLALVPENEPAAGSHHRNVTGGGSKSPEQVAKEQEELQRGTRAMTMLFPPPDLVDTQEEIGKVYKRAMAVGLGAVSAVAVVGLIVVSGLVCRDGRSSSGWFGGSVRRGSSWPWGWVAVTIAMTAALAFGVTIFISSWLSKKVKSIFEDEMWDASRRQEIETVESEDELPESVAWLNSLLASVWPLINPDLFSSLVDTLEDVMQASLPKIVRMVSVDDIGQGSEAFRILGIRWLPTGAAGQSVDTHGNLKSSKDNDRAAPGEGQIEDGEKNDPSQKSDQGSQDDKQNEQQDESLREGLEAEEGDFVNLELAFAYRARSSGKSIRSKAKNAHLYLKFYLPGGIAVPVWVELKGMIGIMRLRLQLTPDPPFFDLCTLTFLGQPRADLSCVPISKHSLNLMDVPLISSFVQSAIDAALAEYVAPKSLTIGLKDMLVGDDFKKDTSARGVIMVHIKHARGFKQGDGGVGPVQGSSDPYVTVAWGKYGKPLASTRIIVDEQNPVWNEYAYILVTAEEINAEESLRLQLWDSDKYTADDDLGRVEVTLKELMHGSKTKNRMCDREDELRAEDPDEKMPGTLAWAVGYFEKAHIQQCQLDKQTVDPTIRSLDDLKKKAEEEAAHKLREAVGAKDESKELHQQTMQDFKEKENAMIISTPPPDGLKSGIVSIQIHNITGLEIAKLNKKSDEGEDREDEAEQSNDLPDSYCTIILNHQKIYRTRTKPRNAKPFFNAGTERFVKDWKTAELIVCVRDSREHEEDPLLGIVYLPLRRVFEKRSQVMETYPLAGGMGYGRARISLVWRSVQLHLPPELAGWDLGTVETKLPVKLISDSSGDRSLHTCRLKLQTKLGRVKLKPKDDEEGVWVSKKAEQHSVFLAVTKRYATPLVVEFRKSSLGPDSSPAFAVLWLCDIPDEEERNVTLKVWKGGKANLKRARSCYGYQGLEDGEQPIGEIEMAVKFWRGLSGYHKAYANKSRNSNLRDVMEVLDTIADEKMGVDEAEAEDDDEDASASDSDSSYEKLGGEKDDKPPMEDVQKRKMLRKAGADTSSDSDSESGARNPVVKLKKQATSLLSGHEDGKDDGSRGVLAQVQDYKKHRKSLHRKHRGVMQWKGARTLDWLVNKTKQGKGKVEGVFEHRDKEQGIETEV